MHPLFPKADTLSGEVIQTALRVHSHFGPGLLESIYVRCLEQVLRNAGHRTSREKPVHISFEGLEIDEVLRYDLLVDDCLLVEAKAVEPCSLNRFRMQLLSYMKLLDIPLGLVLNFGEERLNPRGVRRVILKGADDGASPF